MEQSIKSALGKQTLAQQQLTSLQVNLHLLAPADAVHPFLRLIIYHVCPLDGAPVNEPG